MDPLTLTALGVFLAPYLQKAGEKVAEKTVEALFASQEKLSEKFYSLFHQEIITLDLNSAATTEDVAKRLEANSELRAGIDEKIAANQNLLDELVKALKQKSPLEFGGVAINAEKIAQVNIKPKKVSLNIENF